MSSGKSSAKSERRLHLSIFGRMYDFYSGKNRLLCVYCGDTREAIDHIPAISTVAKVGAKKLREKGVKFFTVPCCNACNTALGGRHLVNFEERILFLYNHYQGKIESKTLWSQAEIDELSGNLRQMIKAKQDNLRRELIQKLRGVEKTMCNIPEELAA